VPWLAQVEVQHPDRGRPSTPPGDDLTRGGGDLFGVETPSASFA